MESQFIQTNGIQLHAKVGGEGDLMIMLHGFPEFWYSWRHQIPVFEQHYRLLVPDMRGYNKSDKPKGVKNYRLELLVDDIRGLIKAFNREKAIIVAHDWGGAVAWTLASHFPDIVDKLIILNMPHVEEMQRQLYRRFNLKQWRRSWYIVFFQLPFLPEKILKWRLQQFFEETFTDWAHNENAFTEEDIQQYVQAMQTPDALKSAINYYRAALRYSKRNDGVKPQKVTAPTLMIWGEDDKALGKELTYNTQHYCTEEVQFRYIPNCSHWVQHEYPELVNKYIMEFLKG